MISFENNTYLIGLVVIIPLALLLFAVIHWKRKVRKALGDEELINNLTNNYSPKLYNAKFIAVLVAIALGILALANLREPTPGENEKRAGIDVMIALDVSKSMLSQDVKPSRLDKAKQCVSMLIDELGENRIGLVIFAGQAVLQMPLTSDVASSKLYISNASTDAIPIQGTDISNALQLCSNSLDTKEKKYKSVVLISDGEDHDPKTKNILQQLYDDGVVVYTVGIGTAEGAPIIEAGNVYKTDINGQAVISKLNEEELKTIAEKTGGNYFHLDESETTANELASQLNNREKKLINDNGSGHEYTSFYPLLAALMLLILVAELFIPEVKKRKRYELSAINKSFEKTCLLVTYYLLLTVFSFGQKANEAIQQGNDAYHKNDFATAIKEYTKALQADDKNAVAKFNMANALQRTSQEEKAAEVYDDVIKNSGDADLQSKAYYNKALSQLQQKNLQGAVDAFKQSLRLSPGDNDTRENLQKALEELKQKQQQQNRNQDQKQKPQPQQKKEQQKQQPKMNQQMMEQKFKELQDQEKQLQKELQKQKTNQPEQEKDW